MSLRDVLVDILVVIGAAVVLIVCAEPYLAPANSAGNCPAPKENEQLHIVVVPRAGQVIAVAECMYITSPGEGKRKGR